MTPAAALALGFLSFLCLMGFIAGTVYLLYKLGGNQMDPMIMSVWALGMVAGTVVFCILFIWKMS